MRAVVGAAAFAALPILCAAETDLTAMTDSERAIFREEVRATLLAYPQIVADALNRPNPVQSAYGDKVQVDLSLLAQITPTLLQGTDIALFVGPGCNECDGAIADLTRLSDTYGATFILHDTTDAQAADWADALEMDIVPFYVLPEIILRGQMPAIVLQKYLGAQ